MQDHQATNINKRFLGSDNVARQATEAEEKLQNSHYDGKKKMCDWDKYVALHKEQHAITESLADYGYSGMDNGTKVCHFLQGIKSTELEAAVKIVWVKPEKNRMHFDATVYYLGHMVMKKSLVMQSVCIVKAQS